MKISEFFKEMKLHAAPKTIKSSFMYTINQEGGGLAISFYHCKNSENIKLECEIDHKDEKTMKKFINKSNEYNIRQCFLELAEQYGGIRSFLTFQPNFKTLYFQLFK